MLFQCQDKVSIYFSFRNFCLAMRGRFAAYFDFSPGNTRTIPFTSSNDSFVGTHNITRLDIFTIKVIVDTLFTRTPIEPPTSFTIQTWTVGFILVKICVMVDTEGLIVGSLKNTTWKIGKEPNEFILTIQRYKFCTQNNWKQLVEWSPGLRTCILPECSQAV